MHMKLAPPDEESSSTLQPEFQPYKLHFVPEEKNLLLEHWRGVELFTDRVVITQTGHYYMYSSVAFRPDSPLKCGDFQYQTWNNSILLTRPENAAVGETLVTATHTCCDECKHNQETTYAAGVFLLQTGDSINVEVSGSRLVSYKPQSTFFGLVLLGSYRTEG
ncbi:tumor necrosis factor ligand superfamily member 15-like [Physella acuta]|uniref:tumor necrosis factor ligand superfamily member 15-like n=1 Tax=Physella acuta TaxID=109671 RepID=UPI0027DD6722|nr:tumor necrosis factor ligand superfamily member 15-like [Physella acuta]